MPIPATTGTAVRTLPSFPHSPLRGASSLRRLTLVVTPSPHPPPLPAFTLNTPNTMARHALWVVLAVVAAAVTVVAEVAGGEADNRRMQEERQVWRTVMEHLNALNDCSLRRLMAQHPYVAIRGGVGGGRKAEGSQVWREGGGRSASRADGEGCPFCCSPYKV